jgi:hypothetical protein
MIVKEKKENEWWRMYFDGVVNMSSNEACTVIIAPSEK